MAYQKGTTPENISKAVDGKEVALRMKILYTHDSGEIAVIDEDIYPKCRVEVIIEEGDHHHFIIQVNDGRSTSRYEDFRLTDPLTWEDNSFSLINLSGALRREVYVEF